MFDSFWTTVLADLSDSFINPQKRIFLGYLLSGFAIAILWSILIKKDSFSTSIKTLSSSKIWCSKSSQSDYKLFLINKCILLLLSPALIGRLVIATSLFYALHEVFPSRPTFFVNSPEWIISILFTLGYFLLDDFARFYLHRLMHKWSALWAFHKVHHSAETLTPFTVFRTHPVEMILFSLRSSIVQATAIAFFVFFMGERADLLTIFSANIFVFAFNILGSNLRHSHVPIAYPKLLEKVFISPAQHQIHHSTATQHRDKNFGVILSLWDRWFNSLYHSEINQILEFGLDKKNIEQFKADDKSHHLRTLYLTPFQDFITICKTIFSKKKQYLIKHKSAVDTQHSIQKIS